MEREPQQNISHKALPSWADHCAFVRRRPYEVWYAITPSAGLEVGCIYLTDRREIGIGILRSKRGLGYAQQAIRELMRIHPGRFLANINPANEASIRLFRGLGFSGPIQITLERAA